MQEDRPHHCSGHNADPLNAAGVSVSQTTGWGLGERAAPMVSSGGCQQDQERAEPVCRNGGSIQDGLGSAIPKR